MNRTYTTTAGEKEITIVISKVTHFKKYKGEDKKFPYVLDIFYEGNTMDGISYKYAEDRDKVAKDLQKLIEGEVVRDTFQQLEKNLKDYDPMGAIR